METVEDKIKEIRKRLRLAMNGIISSSMRQKGVTYKLNFGVPYQEIRQIAGSFEPDAGLAAALWKEDIREFKMLATMLQPVDSFVDEQAKAWVKEIPYLEIAEQCCRNLFCKLSYVENFAVEQVANTEDEYARTVAFLTWTELFKIGTELSESTLAVFLSEAKRTALCPDFGARLIEKQAAIKAMKFYGRQSSRKAARIMELFDAVPSYRDDPESVEIYNDLKFEFEYYR